MEDKPRADIKKLIVDPETFLPDISREKVMTLYVELQMLMEDYERETAIMYLSSNYSNNKHLSATALRAMHDEDIKKIMERTMATVKAELDSRKRQL